MNAVVAAVTGAARAHVDWLTTPHHDWVDAQTFLVPWVLQFVCSWLAFLAYMRRDYELFVAGELYGPKHKLPSRHPLIPFWRSQLRMVPAVLFNQLVVWPLVSLTLIWPIWGRTNTSTLDAPLGGWSVPALVPTFFALMFVSDWFWYWCHRFLHLRNFAGVRVWDNCHRDHHMAEQCALSATFVAPFEYALFTIAMQLFFALAGFPLWLHAVPLSWGMSVGSGAHSGYSGAIANGDEHNAHHLFHGCNFGLLMLADRLHGTYWAPTDPLPAVWEGAADIPASHPDVYGSFEASTFRAAVAKAAAGAERADNAAINASAAVAVAAAAAAAAKKTGGNDGTVPAGGAAALPSAPEPDAAKPAPSSSSGGGARRRPRRD